MSTATQPTSPPLSAPAPKGVVKETIWRDEPDGPLIEHDHEAYVLKSTRAPVGRYWCCRADDCPTGEWVFPELDPEAKPGNEYCPRDGTRLLPAGSGSAEPDAENSAREELRGAFATWRRDKRQQLAAAAAARAAAVREAGKAEARRIAGDLREHLPSAAAGAVLLGAATSVVTETPAGSVALWATVTATAGCVAAYVAACLIQRLLGELRMGTARQRRARARWVASAPVAAGFWMLVAAGLPGQLAADSWQGLVAALLGVALIAVVNYGPWQAMVARRQERARQAQLSAERIAAEEERRLAELAEEERRLAQQELIDQPGGFWDQAHDEQEQRLRAEQEQRAWDDAHAEYEQRAIAEKTFFPTDTEAEAGRKFAKMWQRIQADPDACPFFRIGRTRVVPERTRKMTAPDPDDPQGPPIVVGWEFLINADPGVFAGRASHEPPFLAAAAWLTSMLERGRGEVTLFHEPDDAEGQPMSNHGLVVISSADVVNRPVPYLGRDGILTLPSGEIRAFIGRTLLGKPVYRALRQPGRAGGCNRVGVTGTGKSVVTQVHCLNCLYAGVFPLIHDPKLIDFMDFAGVIPLGSTDEHAEIFLVWLSKVRHHRMQLLANVVDVDEFGDEVAGDALWRPENGPVISATWEEFHLRASKRAFIGGLTQKVRLQRAADMYDDLVSQGAGLSDSGDSNLRTQIGQIRTQLMRMPDSDARLAGVPLTYMPSQLPRGGGFMVEASADGPTIPFRGAYVPRGSVPGSIHRHLYGPGRVPLLTAPELPEVELELARETGMLDVWNLGKTRSGRAELINGDSRIEPGVVPDQFTAPAPETGGGTQPARVRMEVKRVIAAMLADAPDGMTVKQMTRHQWWPRIEGDWNNTPTGAPNASSFSTSLKEPDDAARLAGAETLFTSRPGDGRAMIWSLTKAGRAFAEPARVTLSAVGIIAAEPGTAPSPVAGLFTGTAEVDVAAIEQEALAAAEREAILREEARASFGQE